MPGAWPQPRRWVAWAVVPSFSHSVDIARRPEDVFPWLLDEDPGDFRLGALPAALLEFPLPHTGIDDLDLVTLCGEHLEENVSCHGISGIRGPRPSRP